MNLKKSTAAIKGAFPSVWRRIRQRVAAHRRIFAWGAFIFGVVVIVAGAFIPGLGNYAQSIFVNVGTAMALFGPLLLIERQLDRRITDARQQADRADERARVVGRQVGDLSERVQAGLEDVRERDSELRERAATGADQADLVALYDRADEYGSIDRLGLRLQAPKLFEIWMRIRVVHREEDGVAVALIELSFEDGNLRTLGQTVVWSPGEPPEDVFLGLAESLQRAGQWQRDSLFDPLAILESFANALGRIIDIWSGPGGNPQLRPVAALLDSDWAVTRDGLDSLRTPDIFADRGELLGNSSHAFMRLEQQVEVLGWDTMKFREAFAEAERVHEAFARNSPVGE
jgi:hypothetical protein